MSSWSFSAYMSEKGGADFLAAPSLGARIQTVNVESVKTRQEADRYVAAATVPVLRGEIKASGWSQKYEKYSFFSGQSSGNYHVPFCLVQIIR